MTFPSEISGRAGTRTGHGVRELAVDLASEGRRFLPLWGIGPDLTDLFDDDGNMNLDAIERLLRGDYPDVCTCPLRAECLTPGIHPLYDMTVEDATSEVSAIWRWDASGRNWIGEVLDDGSLVVLEAPVGYRSTVRKAKPVVAQPERKPVESSPTLPSPLPAPRPESLGPSTAIYSAAHAWAHWWAEQGFRVFRVCGIREEDGLLVGDCWTQVHDNPNWECWPRPTVRKVCTHPKPGKSPFVTSWKEGATTDRNTIDWWFRESPNANYAVVIEPGYVVLDFDTPDEKHSWRDGHQEVAELGGLPPTRTFYTGSGGDHQLFRTDHDNGCSIPAFEGLHMKGIVDVKAYGLGYIIGTGSRHHSGSYYTCPDPSVEIARAPEWLYVSPLDPKPGRRRPSKAQQRIKAGHKLRDGYVEDPEAALFPATQARLGLGKMNGWQRYEDDDQSQVTFQIVMGAIRAHYPLEKLFVLLRRPDSVGGMGLRKRIHEEGDEFARAWLDGMVEKAFFYLASNREAVRRMMAEATQTTFKRTRFIGRNGTREGCNPDTIEKVLHAVLTIAEERSSLDPMVGISYQLPGRTGLPDTTCRRGIQALEALGWIGDVTEVPSEDGTQNAYTYRLLTDPKAREHPPGRAMPPRKRGPRGAAVASPISSSSDSDGHPGLKAYVQSRLHMKAQVDLPGTH